MKTNRPLINNKWGEKRTNGIQSLVFIEHRLCTGSIYRPSSLGEGGIFQLQNLRINDRIFHDIIWAGFHVSAL